MSRRDDKERFLVDFGQNLVGWVRLKVSGSAGTTVALRHGEILDGEGNLYTANLRSAEQTDHYTLEGDVQEVFEPHFTTHGFRYLEVTGRPGELGGDVTAVVLHNDLAQTGDFACSDARKRTAFFGSRQPPSAVSQRGEVKW